MEKINNSNGAGAEFNWHGWIVFSLVIVVIIVVGWYAFNMNKKVPMGTTSAVPQQSVNNQQNTNNPKLDYGTVLAREEASKISLGLYIEPGVKFIKNDVSYDTENRFRLTREYVSKNTLEKNLNDYKTMFTTNGFTVVVKGTSTGSVITAENKDKKSSVELKSIGDGEVRVVFIIMKAGFNGSALEGSK